MQEGQYLLAREVSVGPGAPNGGEDGESGSASPQHAAPGARGSESGSSAALEAAWSRHVSRLTGIMVRHLPDFWYIAQVRADRGSSVGALADMRQQVASREH